MWDRKHDGGCAANDGITTKDCEWNDERKEQRKEAEKKKERHGKAGPWPLQTRFFE